MAHARGIKRVKPLGHAGQHRKLGIRQQRTKGLLFMQSGLRDNGRVGTHLEQFGQNAPVAAPEPGLKLGAVVAHAVRLHRQLPRLKVQFGCIGDRAVKIP